MEEYQLMVNIKEDWGSEQDFNEILEQVRADKQVKDEVADDIEDKSEFLWLDWTFDTWVKIWQGISDISKKFKFDSNVDDWVIKSWAKFLWNLPANTVQIGGDLISVLSDPIGTVQSVWNLATAWIESWLNKLFLEEWEEFFTSDEVKQTAESVGSELSKLWEPWRIKELLVENPADVLLTFLWGVGVAKNVAKSKNLTGLVNKLEKVEDLTNPIKIQSEALNTLGKWKDVVKSKLFPEKWLDDLVLEISQGKKSNIPAVKESLSKLDTREIKTFEELNTSIWDKITELSRKQDELLPSQATLKVEDLSTTKGKRTTNFIESALDDLEKVWLEGNDLELLNKVDDIRAKSLISEKDINDLARFYGSTFKNKSFDAKGNPKSSLTASKFENTRSWLKNKSRELLPDDSVKAIDDELSKLFETKLLTDKMADNVVNLQKKISERGLAEKVARWIGKWFDLLTLNTASWFLTSFLPSNIGNKVLNSLAIESNLAKNLKRLEELNKKADNISEVELQKQSSSLLKDIVWNNPLKIEASSLEQNLEDK